VGGIEPHPATLLGMTLSGIAVAILRPCQAHAQVVDVSDTAELAQAINSVNAGTATGINITAPITLSGNLPVITGNATIIGNGNTISGNNQFRVFFVLSGTVSIRNVAIVNGLAQGASEGM
jgi:fibronectin-binding autotransporter adhesin